MERRKHDRLALEDLSAKIYRSDDQSEVDFFPINVSKSGFAIFTDCYLAEATELKLVLSNDTVELVVCWCRPKKDDLAVFRCGLEVKSKDISLDKIIQEELNID